MAATFGAATDGTTVVRHFADQVKGRTFLLTGPSKGGIGSETVISLAHGSPDMIVLIGRTLAKVQDAIDAIKETNADIRVKFIETDLASLKSVRKAAEAILNDAEISQIDVVINNAGVMACSYTLTEDGIELQLAASLTGHFVLTNKIMPKILAAGAGSRIVLVSSTAHRYRPFNLEDPNFAAEGTYTEYDGYGSAKSAEMLYGVALNRRLAAPRGIHTYAVHPGGITTNLQEHVKAHGEAHMMEVFDRVCRVVNGVSIADYLAQSPLKTLQQGCSTTLVAALDPDLVNRKGYYLEDCTLTTDPALSKTWATDPDLAEECWRKAEELVGETFEF
ncbi:retinol dehydrogenase 13 [Apiospora aurea]|uniref:Retinol dehydrogenase 13 n=1 Tax=Apiospora aurea TaxID=335848 RepID=A0ABR1QHR8_9PEZI